VLPNRARWRVNWKKIDADVWLVDKWKKFAEFFSLDQDHLLLFRYVGKSQFKVVILDQTGLEIVYPLMEGSVDGADNRKSFRQRKRVRFSVPSSPSAKKAKINPRKKPYIYPTEYVGSKYARSQRTKVELPKKFSGEDVEFFFLFLFHFKVFEDILTFLFVSDIDLLTDRRKNRRCSKSEVKTEFSEDTESGSALERAYSFHSENPFFIRQMHRSFIIGTFLVYHLTTQTIYM